MIKNIILLATIIFPLTLGAQTRHTIHVDSGVYKPTVNRWIAALDKYSKTSSVTYITKETGGKDKLHRVGHRDLIVWIPKYDDPLSMTGELTVVFWFHGHHGYIQHRTFEDRILKQFSPRAKEGKQFVVVLPEMPWSINTKTPTKRNGLLWQKPGEFLGFVDQVKGILLNYQTDRGLALGKLNYRVVGHSAGGSTIATIAHTGDLCKINPSLVVWSDSSYGGWLTRAWNGCLGTHNIRTEVFVKKGGAPWRRSTHFMGEFQGQPEFLHLHVKTKPWTHKKIGNNIVELSGILD